MKKIILTFALLITAAAFTSYIEPTNEVKIDKNSSTLDIKGNDGAKGVL